MNPYPEDRETCSSLGGTSGGTWIGKYGRNGAVPVIPNFPHVVEMARLGAWRPLRAIGSKWLKRPLLYH